MTIISTSAWAARPAPANVRASLRSRRAKAASRPISPTGSRIGAASQTAGGTSEAETADDAGANARRLQGGAACARMRSHSGAVPLHSASARIVALGWSEIIDARHLRERPGSSFARSLWPATREWFDHVNALGFRRAPAVSPRHSGTRIPLRTDRKARVVAWPMMRFDHMRTSLPRRALAQRDLRSRRGGAQRLRQVQMADRA